MYVYIADDQVAGLCPEPDIVPNGFEVAEWPDDINISCLFWANGELQLKPDRPSDDHVWVKDSWELPPVQNLPTYVAPEVIENTRLLKLIEASKVKPTVAILLQLTLALWADTKGDSVSREDALNKLEETLKR